jgi:hypothetical protein
MWSLCNVKGLVGLLAPIEGEGTGSAGSRNSASILAASGDGIAKAVHESAFKMLVTGEAENRSSSFYSSTFLSQLCLYD